MEYTDCAVLFAVRLKPNWNVWMVCDTSVFPKGKNFMESDNDKTSIVNIGTYHFGFSWNVITV